MSEERKTIGQKVVDSKTLPEKYIKEVQLVMDMLNNKACEIRFNVELHLSKYFTVEVLN